MALIKCSGCGQIMSDKASTCPNCGKSLCSKEITSGKNSREKKPFLKPLVIMLVVSIAGVGYYLINNENDSAIEMSTVKEYASVITDSKNETTDDAHEISKKGNWNYQNKKDPLTDEITNIAHCVSDNTSTVCDESTELNLGVIHNSKGNYVILSVNKGVLRQEQLPMAHVRFDDGEIKMWSVMPDGAKYHHIVAANDFISQLRRSKKCAIKIEAQDGGTATYSFHTAGLEWNYVNNAEKEQQSPYAEYAKKGYKAGQRYGREAVTSKEDVLYSAMAGDYVKDYDELPNAREEKVKAYTEAYKRGFLETYGK